jgi:predicted O-linked N-acetylglucosamine transferase (SPINDLY family)
VAQPVTAQRVEEARQRHLRGDLAGAIAIYQQVLEGDGGLGDVWHLKGMAEHQAGQLDQALASALRAIDSGGEKAPYLVLQGGVLQERGEFAAAEACFSRAVAVAPHWAPALVERGSARLDLGRPSEALEDFRAAVGIDPRSVRGWNNLGVALQTLERLDDALRAFDHALTINPRFARAHFNAARIHNMRNDRKLALQHAQAATRSDASHVDAWLLLGDILRRQDDSAGAIAAYSSAAKASGGSPRALNALAELLAEVGRHDEARRGYWQVSQAAPDNYKSALGANLLLPQVYASTEHLEIARREYLEGLERLHAAAPGFRFGRRDAALQEARWTNFYLAYQGRNDRVAQRRYGELQRRVLEPVVPEFFRPLARRAPRDRLRVGFFSHFFFNCTAGRYFSSWVTHLDGKRFEKYVYYTNEWVADDTRAIAAAAHVFRHLPGRPLNALARQVLADELDILVFPELGMYADTFTLAGLRLAPCQVAGWGHPTSPGLPSIDWYFSSAPMEGAEAPDHYSERLGLLPGLGTRYALPKAPAPATRADFGLPEDRTLYLVPQSLFKIHPDNDELVARVLESDARGVAVLFASTHDPVTQSFGNRLGPVLGRRGIDIRERAPFLMPTLPHHRYLQLNSVCDVMLDTVHWSGGNTSLDAIASGLPVVTLPGTLMRGRQSQAMLQMLGAPELIAANPDEYVRTAVRLGKDADERRAVSERLRANRLQLFERDEPVRALEALLERAYRETPA